MKIDPVHFHGTYPRYVKRLTKCGEVPESTEEFYRQKREWNEAEQKRMREEMEHRIQNSLLCECGRGTVEKPGQKCDQCILDNMHEPN